MSDTEIIWIVVIALMSYATYVNYRLFRIILEQNERIESLMQSLEEGDNL